MAGRLVGKTAVITGSDSGIGQATAIEFAHEGADIIVTYLHDRAGADHTCETVQAAGRRALVIQADLTDERHVAALFDGALEAFGTIDILMNCAGVDASATHLADLATEAWDQAINANLYGPSSALGGSSTSASKRAMAARSSMSRLFIREQARAGGADYDCSKGALRNLTRTLALELAPDRINVNNIGPGMVLTPFNQQAIDDPGFLEKQVQSIPWKRAAKPEEIGRLAVFLASSDADYVTGSTYYMDGGLMQNAGQGA